VVGAGFGGLGTAIRLRQAGFQNLTLFERCADLGAACLVPSPDHRCSGESGEPVAPVGRPPTSPRALLAAAGMRRQLRACAERFGLLPRIRLGTEVRAATFDEAGGCWQLGLEDHDMHRADVLVVATGGATWPCIPPVPGRSTGRRVAVVGTGMHAAWFVPYLVPDVTGLWVFSDGPPHPIDAPAHRRQSPARAANRSMSGLLRRDSQQDASPAAGPSSLRSPDPSEAPQALPSPEGQPHIMLSPDRRPPLDRRRIQVVADRLAEFRPDGLVAADGTVWDADVVLFTTGFTAVEFLAPLAAAGGGAAAVPRLVRRDGPGAYLGVSVAHLPNLYLLYGPHPRRVRLDRIRGGEPGPPPRVVRPAASRR
jgi:cation diffusion facilitator CzcD-associated flavoprotein CzcO